MATGKDLLLALCQRKSRFMWSNYRFRVNFPLQYRCILLMNRGIAGALVSVIAGAVLAWVSKKAS